jgi:hypothetical protein
MGVRNLGNLEVGTHTAEVRQRESDTGCFYPSLGTVFAVVRRIHYPAAAVTGTLPLCAILQTPPTS